MAVVARRIRYRFGRHDLLRTRFAISPLIERAAAMYVLRLPRQFPEHRPWVAEVAPRVAGLRLDLVHAASPLGRTTWPNFDAPPPVVPHPRIEDELDRLAATDPGLVRSDVLRAHRDGVPADARPFVDDPAGALATMVEQTRALWDAALAPWWPRMSAFLESEIAARARRLVATGSAAAFADLDPTVSWDGRDLTVSPVTMEPRDVELDGRGLLLIPSVLAWSVWPRVDPPWDPALTYQPPGVRRPVAAGHGRRVARRADRSAPGHAAPVARAAGLHARPVPPHRLEPRRRQLAPRSPAPDRSRRTPTRGPRGRVLAHRRGRQPVHGRPASRRSVRDHQRKRAVRQSREGGGRCPP